MKNIKKIIDLIIVAFISIILLVIVIEVLGLVNENFFVKRNLIPQTTNYSNLKKESELYSTDYDFSDWNNTIEKLYDSSHFDFYKHYRLPKNFKSKLINTDKNGLRKTYTPNKDFSEKKVIAFFGGSTTFGLGAEDDNSTIPSYVSKILNDKYKNIFFEVHNFGTNGYNNSQELIYFIENLDKYKFDYVFFYDFVNEHIHALLEQGRQQYRRSDNFLTPIYQYNLMLKYIKTYDQSYILIDLVRSRSYTVKVLRKIFAYLGLINQSGYVTYEQSIDSLENDKLFLDRQFLIKRAIKIYIRNMNVINSLANQFDFKAYHVLQPNLFTKKNLSNFENKNISLIPTDKINTLVSMYDQARLINTPNKLIDLSSIFDSVNETIFIDDHHLNSKGAKIIANEVSKIFTP